MARKTQTQDQGPDGKRAVKPPELAIWKMMIQRSRNPRYAGTKNYGVPICERWLGADGFASFLADVGPQPFAGVGLRRLDEGKPFEPGNVEWGPTRGTILTYDGRSISQAEWAKNLEIKPSTLRARRRKGWSVEKMLTRKVPNRFPYNMWNRNKAKAAKERESAPR
jgi:hypothetical protein